MASPLEQSLATVHPFAFTPLFRAASLPFGVVPGTCRVELLGTHLAASFGPWHVSTPIANIERAEVTGPYDWPRVIGPAHLSIADHGLTFATNPTAGVCLTFHEPVRGIDPLGWIRHPGLTVTVADPERLVADLEAASGSSEEIERDERSLLEGRTASELRELAKGLGLTGVSSMKKADLVDRLLADDRLAAAALDHELTGGSGSAA